MIETILRVNSLGLALIVIFIGALGYALGLATKGMRAASTVYLVWSGYETVECCFLTHAEAEQYVKNAIRCTQTHPDSWGITECQVGE